MGSRGYFDGFTECDFFFGIYVIVLVEDIFGFCYLVFVYFRGYCCFIGEFRVGGGNGGVCLIYINVDFRYFSCYRLFLFDEIFDVSVYGYWILGIFNIIY